MIRLCNFPVLKTRIWAMNPAFEQIRIAYMYVIASGGVQAVVVVVVVV